MGKQTKLGIYFSYNENWIGGSYYIMNVIEALKLLPKKDLPKILFILTKKDDINTLKNINYPFAKYVVIGDEQPKQVLRKIANRLTFNKFTLTTNSKINKLDIVFPFEITGALSKIKERLNWIPDFQELHLPKFFSEKEIISRKKRNQRIADEEKYVVFSSRDAQKDFDSFYPNSDIKKFILNFAVTHPDYDYLDIDNLKEKHGIVGKYFFSPNQFWAHKNHMVILRALKLLKDLNKLNFMVAFSGKEHDYRNPDYFEILKNFVSENQLENNVRFLGFIDRKEQLKLMKNSEAIIQPSFFEGWSTVIEDAKAMNQCIIASDIEVNMEQLEENAYYFNPNKEEELSEIMLKALLPNKIKYSKNYQEDIYNFGLNFNDIIQNIMNSKK